MITTLRLQCPACQRQIVRTEAADAETAIVRRTCRGCKTRWLIKICVAHRKSDTLVAHRVEWLPLADLDSSYASQFARAE